MKQKEMELGEHSSLALPNLYEIKQDQVENAKVFSTRLVALDFLVPKNIKYLEIGVLCGDYSEQVIKRKNPSSAILLDAYGQFDYSKVDSRITKDTHLDFVKNRFLAYDNVEILNGRSEKVLPIINRKFDYIYIDANHSYEFVLKDLINSHSMLSEDGIIGLNDYMAIGHNDGEDYEVIYAVNEFLHIYPNFEVVGFAMNKDMYADIYLKAKVMV